MSALVVSSTVPVLAVAWSGVGESALGVDTLLIGPGVRSGMPILMDNPREVGPDRIVNAVAALARAGGPCIAVDFGTSTNFDAVSAAGEYVGGVLAPGVAVSMEALFDRAARLARVEFVAPPTRDRAQHRARAAERRRLRLRRAGRRHRAAHGRGARRQPPRARDGRPGRA